MGIQQYDPEKHHRRSIRLKRHDYSGGGIYFVTICANQGLGIAPFETTELREIIFEEWKKCAELRNYVHLDAFVVMPDHFHALIGMDGGAAPLGEVIGAFKAAVSRRWRRSHPAGGEEGGIHPAEEGDMHVARTTAIWHRNYYERIIRGEKDLENVRNYIRRNPWKLVVGGNHNGRSYRAIGNPNLLNMHKLGILCSRDCPEATLLKAKEAVAGMNADTCVISGCHSFPEKEIVEVIFRGDNNVRVIVCPAWGIGEMGISDGWIRALEQNRLLIMEMQNSSGDIAAARERNEFIMQTADRLMMPYISSGGMLDGLARNLNTSGRIVRI